MSEGTPLMFSRLAEQYDPLAARKDYRGESERLVRLARRYGNSRGSSWLDVACGTGRHLEFLRRSFSVTGVDSSAAMLRIARRRLPGVPLVRADMRTLRLRPTFDVVSCLFSAIGHLRNESELRATFATFARHLNPGGVAIIEPWIDPERFRSGSVHLVTFEGPRATIARLAYSRRRGARSLVRYHYLIGRPGRGIQHVAETVPGLLVSPRRLVELLRGAGLEARFLARGLTPGRGLLVGRKPEGQGRPVRRGAGEGR